MTDTTTTHDVTYRAPEPITPELYALYERMAASAATSGLYTADGDTKATKEQCLMVLLYGHDLGVPTTAALQGINIFGDSMELSAGLLAGLIDRHPIYDYDAVVSTDVLCTINLFKHGVLFKTVSFGIADAQRAQLLDSPYYRQFPAAMMFARCMSTLVRRHCPGVTSGIPVYVAGETKAGLRSRDANLRNGPAAAATNDSGNGAVAPAADTPPHDDAPVSAEQRDMLIAAAMSAGFKPHAALQRDRRAARQARARRGRSQAQARRAVEPRCRPATSTRSSRRSPTARTPSAHRPPPRPRPPRTTPQQQSSEALCPGRSASATTTSHACAPTPPSSRSPTGSSST